MLIATANARVAAIISRDRYARLTHVRRSDLSPERSARLNESATSLAGARARDIASLPRNLQLHGELMYVSRSLTARAV